MGNIIIEISPYDFYNKGTVYEVWEVTKNRLVFKTKDLKEAVRYVKSLSKQTVD